MQENSSCYRQAGSTGLYTHLMKENTVRGIFGMPRENLLVTQYTVPLLWRSSRYCSNPILGKHVWE